MLLPKSEILGNKPNVISHSLIEQYIIQQHKTPSSCYTYSISFSNIKLHRAAIRHQDILWGYYGNDTPKPRLFLLLRAIKRAQNKKKTYPSCRISTAVLSVFIFIQFINHKPLYAVGSWYICFLRFSAIFRVCITNNKELWPVINPFIHRCSCK